MTSIPKPENTAISAIDAWHECKKEKPRYHLGASQLGHHCERWLWLSFRWAIAPSFPGRVLRLFRRGHHEEKWFVSDLRAIGVDIQCTTENQSYVDFGCMVGGSLDGIIESGLPEAPNTRHVAEFKTHSSKSFKDLQAKGVEASKWVHFVQMQLYMHAKKINRAYYLAVNKDTDELYGERIKYRPDVAKKYIERGHRITQSERMPEPCAGASPDWYLCKFCDAYDFCHGSNRTYETNCRTCAHLTPHKEGFKCERWGDDVPYYFQVNGCSSHVYHPDLVPWKLDCDKSTELIACWDVDGKLLYNGEPSDGVFTSDEIASNLAECLENDPVIAQIRKTFDAEVVG